MSWTNLILQWVVLSLFKDCCRVAVSFLSIMHEGYNRKLTSHVPIWQPFVQQLRKMMILAIMPKMVAIVPESEKFWEMTTPVAAHAQTSWVLSFLPFCWWFTRFTPAKPLVFNTIGWNPSSPGVGRSCHSLPCSKFVLSFGALAKHPKTLSFGVCNAGINFAPMVLSQILTVKIVRKMCNHVLLGTLMGSKYAAKHLQGCLE